MRGGEQAFVKVNTPNGVFEYEGRVQSFSQELHGAMVEMTVRLIDENNFARHPSEVSRRQPPPIKVRGKSKDRKLKENQTEKENTMDKYKVTVIRELKTKSALIYVQVLQPDMATKNEVYLTGSTDLSNSEEVERLPGQEMPIYTKMPDELYLPFVNATRSASFSDDEG